MIPKGSYIILDGEESCYLNQSLLEGNISSQNWNLK